MRTLFLVFTCLLSNIFYGQLPQLSSSDKESPVFLQQLAVDVRVLGNKSVTTFTMTFHNPSERVLEGSFLFPLPQDAIVTRYALDINGKMREGVPVEKAQATQIFESIERRQVDPGLLEKTEGNNFRTRIYPVPARGERSVIIAYEQELTGQSKGELVYRLPLYAEKPIEKVKLHVQVSKPSLFPLLDSTPVSSLSFTGKPQAYFATFEKENVQLQGGLLFRIPKNKEETEAFLQMKGGKRHFYLYTPLPDAVKQKKLPRKLAIIWDASLSGLFRDTAKELQLLKNYLRKFDNTTVQLYSLNHKFQSHGVFTINEGRSEWLLKKIRSLTYDGGTDFSKIISPGVEEILLFTDGLNTLSDKAMSFSCPLFSITSSLNANFAVLQTMAERTGGAFINLKAISETAAQEILAKQRLFFLGVKGTNDISEAYPSYPIPVQNSFTMAGIIKREPLDLRLQFGYGREIAFEKVVRLSFAKQNPILDWEIGRLVAQKKIAELEGEAERNKAEILRLGKEHSLVTSFTSLLVLDRVEDYVEHEIQPPVELIEEYNRLMAEKRSEITERKKETLENAVDYSDELWVWWKTNFPVRQKEVAKFTPPQTAATQSVTARDSAPAPNVQAEGLVSNLNVVEDEETTVRRALSGAASGVTALSEVVVIGYSTARVTGSKNSEIFDKRLLVVDGRIADSMPARDAIESMETISTREGIAIYGSSAINGVLLVTTKAAKKNNAPQIELVEQASGADYLQTMAETKPSLYYSAYLSLREKNLLNPTFYYDMAAFFSKRNKELALQMLTNLGELDFQNHELFKLFGFKLRELRDTELARYVFRKILQWRPQQPQSYRDYALVLSDAGLYQQALDTLFLALSREYKEDVMSRYDGIGKTIITEMNHLVNRFPYLNTSRIPKKLLHKMPVDIRVVLNWNMNDTDIDLWVTDPKGEKCYYNNSKTKIGGRLSSDCTDGYGPEQFLLKKAAKGKYKIQVHYYGNSRQKLAGKTTLLVEVYTNYGKTNAEQKFITLQLGEEEKEGIYVGEFVF